MSLIIALGSNINPQKNIYLGLDLIRKYFKIKKVSSIYTSKAVDNLDQSDFLNLVVECEIPKLNPGECIEKLQKLEKIINKKSKVNKGPREIDFDIIFWNLDIVVAPNLCIPHPSWLERSFVYLPLLELPFAKKYHLSKIIEQKQDQFCIKWSSA